MRFGRLEVTAGALLAGAVLFYLDRDGTFFWCMISCILHELGHWAAIRMTGGKVAAVRITPGGAEMRLSAKSGGGHGAWLLRTLAGPGVNLALAGMGVWTGGEWGLFFSGINLALACFNLLPMERLDGGQALRHFTALIWSEEAGERLVRLTTWAAAALALGAGVWLLARGGGNFTLLLAAAWLTLPEGQRRRRGARM